jgi:hypothetical protein
MGNCHSYKIELFHTLGTPESERIKVTALNLFPPTASPPFQNVGFFNTMTQPLEGEGCLPAGKQGWGVSRFVASVLVNVRDPILRIGVASPEKSWKG